MPWYQKPNDIDKSKPIFMRSRITGDIYVLLKTGSSEYQWLNIKTGKLDSPVGGISVERMISGCLSHDTEIFSGTLTYERS